MDLLSNYLHCFKAVLELEDDEFDFKMKKIFLNYFKSALFIKFRTFLLHST
jgi:hypothetical protein